MQQHVTFFFVTDYHYAAVFYHYFYHFSLSTFNWLERMS